MRKARSSVKKSRKNATVDLRVQINRMKVKINQPCYSESALDRELGEKKDETYHEVEAERVGESSCPVCLFNAGYDLESTRS